MKYQLLRDFYLVLVDNIWESGKTKSGLITSHTATNNDHEDLEDEREKKRRYGHIIEVPASFSDTVVDLIDTGAPQPRKYVGHDWLMSMRNGGYRGYREHEHPELRYYPSTFEAYETRTMKDIGRRMTCKVGDLVYFEPKATDVERKMGPYKGGLLFSVQVNEIQCSIEDVKVFPGYGKYTQRRIVPQGDWTFVELDMEDWEEITIPIQGQPQGLLMKSAPEHKPLQGRVIASQLPIEGRTVFFERDADAPIVVEGRELTVMREEDILATLKQ